MSESAIKSSLIDKIYNSTSRMGSLVTPVHLQYFAVRVYLFAVFYKSALTKFPIETNGMNQFSEFTVPLLSPQVAAYVGTYVELIFPLLLLVGIFSRFAAFTMFFFNLVAFYAFSNMDDFVFLGWGSLDHTVYGVMFALLFFTGPGKLSLDHGIKKFVFKK